jgi:hypothetical protein
MYILVAVLFSAIVGVGMWPTRLDEGVRLAVRPPKKVVVYHSERLPAPAKHVAHEVKAWTTRYRGRIFRVIQLPRCEHLEAVIAQAPAGETMQQAKLRLGGVAVSTGAFHNPRTFSPADFIQRGGRQLGPARTGRWMFMILADQTLQISDNYMLVRKDRGIEAIALGQRLVPFHRDGFSTAFINAVTDRNAIGLSVDHIYIVQGRSDLWHLAEFMKTKLPVKIAVNTDGGHVLRGRAPTHIVFRWRKLPPPPAGKLPTTKGSAAPGAK